LNSIKEVLDELNIFLDDIDKQLITDFQENGYCIIQKSNFVTKNLNNFRSIIDELLKKESWRGGWEGKEEYLKYGKKFNTGAYRLANLFNKHELFLKLLSEENILKIIYGILGNDFKIGGLDMREPMKGTGWQELHIDWLPKKTLDEPTQNIVGFIFLDDANKENGSMRLVPKTHKKTGWIDDYQKDKSSHPDEIFVNVRESSIVLMDANLWHSGTTNNNGNRRRVLYVDVRRRDIPQLLNQRIYLDETTQEKLNPIEKYLLGLRENDSIFEDRVFTVGNVYRKHFKTDVVVKQS
jgi:ectoine hydroxylase-related dioxygenase (phytanoyl-CoA dioxygenase family)